MNVKILDEHPMILDRKLAKIIGLNESIVLQYIHYWLVKNEENKINYKNGRYWTFNSIEKWHKESFFFWSKSTLVRIFASLEKSGILLVGNYNKSYFDKTKWYSIDYEKLEKIISEKSSETKEKEECKRECAKKYDKNINMENDKYNNEKIIQNKKKSCISHIIDGLSEKAKMDFIKMKESNDSSWTNGFFEDDKTNTKNYTDTKSIIIKQPLTKEVVAEKDMLKNFLKSDYTESYAIKIINLVKDKGKDPSYLREKINIAKSKKLNSKCGYLYDAVKNDYKEISFNGFRNKNKFINFEQTFDKESYEKFLEKKRKELENFY